MDSRLIHLFNFAPLLGNMAFFSGVATGAVVLIAAFVYGIIHFQQPVGKFVGIAAGGLLVILLAFVVFVLFVSESTRRGAPF